MLDPGHPSSRHIFQASVYIDRLKVSCYDYVLLDFEERQPLFEDMIATAGELLDFSEAAFPESYEKIKELTVELLEEIHKLRRMSGVTEAGRCKVCSGELDSLTTYHQGSMTEVSLCKDCSRHLIRKISALERPTGVWAI